MQAIKAKLSFSKRTQLPKTAIAHILQLIICLQPCYQVNEGNLYC